ncbi:MAG: WYL domain-containing protein, partial [Anaerolineae bacterium]|nr:WYL domain-containing protein [Anaerolineae bacterium]
RTLLLSGTVGPLADLGLAKELESALLKLLAALPESQRDRAEHMRIRLHLDPAWWFQPAEEVPHLRILQQAIWNDCRTHIVYQRGDGSIRERLIEPYGLVAKANIWYLVASIGKEMRVYRVSRIETVEVLDECFLRPPDFDLAAYWTEWCREFETTRPRYEVKLRISPELAQRLPGLWGIGMRQRIEEAPPEADGWRTIPAMFETQEWAAASILVLGDQAEVIEPAELKAEIIHLARQVLNISV